MSRGERPAGRAGRTLFMAAVAGEFIKGFHVAHEACRLLRQSAVRLRAGRHVRPAGAGRIDEFTRSVGWCSQAELPRHYRAADICLVPTIAQDGLSITSVEAMASGLPVIASRIGGVPYTVERRARPGLLFEPGDPADLARQIARLLDDPDLRRRMGLAGRQAVRGGLHLGDRDRTTLAAVAGAGVRRHWAGCIALPLRGDERGSTEALVPDLRCLSRDLADPSEVRISPQSGPATRRRLHEPEDPDVDQTGRCSTSRRSCNPTTPGWRRKTRSSCAGSMRRSIHVAAMLQPRSIVEIGVRAGYSAAAFLSAAPDCTYLGLDADQDRLRRLARRASRRPGPSSPSISATGPS